MTFSLRSTSTRTFLALPAVALVESALSRRRPHLAYLGLMPWGYLQYRLCGDYRTRRGGGGPGMSSPPQRLVTTGPYALSRNPMYLGHIVFLAGLTLVTRSRVVALSTVAVLPWFDKRARDDEQRLLEQLGPEYARYREAVPRWFTLVPWRRERHTVD